MGQQQKGKSARKSSKVASSLLTRVAKEAARKTVALENRGVHAQIKPVLDVREVFGERSEYYYDAYDDDYRGGYDGGYRSGYRDDPGEDEIELGFKIGAGKLYVLKDLYEFKDGFATAASLKLGKSNEVILDRACFEPRAQPLIDFIFNNLQGTPHIYSRSYYYNYYSYQAKKTLDLTPEMLDALFAVLVETGEGTLAVKAKSNTPSDFLLANRNPSVRIECLQEAGGVKLRCPNLGTVLTGARHIYLMRQGIIYLCTEEFTQSCAHLLKALADESQKVFFADKDVPALLGSVLIPAREHLDIDIPADILALTPDPLVTKIYFDVEDNDDVTAYMTFTYGAHTHDAFRSKRSETSFNLAAELQAEALLESYMGSLLFKPGMLLLEANSGNDQALFELATRGIEAMSKIAEVYVSDAFDRIRLRPPVNVSVGVRIDGRLLEVDFDLQGIDFEELGQILASYRRARKYHRLRDGSFLSLEDDSLAQFSEIVEGLDITIEQLADGHASLDVNRALYIDAMMKQSESLRYERDQAFREIIKNMHSIEDADFEVPDSLKSTLRNYQKTGYRWLQTLRTLGFGGILADDMGLGKTLQVLSLLQAEKQRAEGGFAPSIVVCPASLVLNWVSEAQHFTPGLVVLPVLGTAKERQRLIASPSPDLIVTSYDLLKRDIKHYGAVEFDCIILDEAQYIKNQGTQNAKAVKLLRGGTRLALTGTPVENSLAELWSIFDFMMPGYLHRYSRFRESYESPIVKMHDEVATERLRMLVRPFILRRLKGDVLKELPEKIESVLHAEMGTEQRKIYLAVMAQAKAELARELEKVGAAQGRIMVLAALTRMRQVCCDPALLFADYTGGSAKLETCLELIDNSIESEHRILLFSQFTSMLNLLEKQLEKRGIEYYRLDGSTPTTERLALVNRFNAGTVPIFLISLKAGGTGLNLTGADVVIHFDPWWNLSVQRQATDRAHRIGQEKRVQEFKLIMKGTIEERILEMQQRKAELADSIIQEGGNAFDKLTSEELLSLFNDR